MRKVNDVLNDYTEIERKVRKATSNKPYAAAGSLLAEIAEATYNSQQYPQIMNMIWKRLNEPGKYWRHVYKALILLEYLLKVGSEKVIGNVKENMFALATLKDFQHVDSYGKDEGVNVRKKADMLVGLVKDEARLNGERSKALDAQKKYREQQKQLQAQVYNSGSTAQAAGVPRTHSAAGTATGSGAANEEKARKIKMIEEEQLKLAMEMSKADAEEEAKRRRENEENDPDLQAAIALSQVDAMFLSAPQADKDLFDLSDYEDNSLPTSRTSSMGHSSGKPTPVNDPFGGTDPFASTATSDPFGGAGMSLFGPSATTTPPIVVAPPGASYGGAPVFGGAPVLPNPGSAGRVQSGPQPSGGQVDEFVSLAKSRSVGVTPPPAPNANPWDMKPIAANLPPLGQPSSQPMMPMAPMAPITPLSPTPTAGAPKPTAAAGGDKYSALINLDGLTTNTKPASPYSPQNPFGIPGGAPGMGGMPGGSPMMGGYQQQPMGGAGYNMGGMPQQNLYAQPNPTGFVSPGARSPQMQHQPPAPQQNFNPFA